MLLRTRQKNGHGDGNASLTLSECDDNSDALKWALACMVIKDSKHQRKSGFAFAMANRPSVSDKSTMIYFSLVMG